MPHGGLKLPIGNRLSEGDCSGSLERAVLGGTST